jgi:hypothetical protein
MICASDVRGKNFTLKNTEKWDHILITTTDFEAGPQIHKGHQLGEFSAGQDLWQA